MMRARWSRAARTVSLVSRVFATCLLALTHIGCQNGECRDGLSLVWISLDTLRADHLSLHGHARETTPFLDALAREGAYVDWAVAPQSSTLPVHVTQFTGIHPVVHGVMHATNNPGVRLRDAVRTLPEVLRQQGFVNRAWVDGGQMDGSFGFERGFESYDDTFTPFPRKLAQSIAALGELRPDDRFFHFIQTYEIHSPYAPPPAYVRRFVTEGERSGATASMDRYDGSIRFADDAIRSYVARLEAAGWRGRTVIVVTGDHGESFAEYGVPAVGHHARLLRQNLTRVPWIVSHPSEALRGRVVAFAGLQDFANTTLALLGVDERMRGGGRAIFDDAPPDTAAYVSWAGPGAWSIYRGGLHYLESDTPGPARNGLFDVARDPLEHARLEGDPREAEMAALLGAERQRLLAAAERQQAGLREQGTLSEALGDQLRALGYAVDPEDAEGHAPGSSSPSAPPVAP